MASSAAEQAPTFATFRVRDAESYREDGPMLIAPMSEVEQAGLAALNEAGMEGGLIRVLYKGPDICLSYAWLKSGFLLPLHSHDSDCLYFVVAGSLRLGTEELGAGDGFFVGPGIPYSYVPGDGGVEILEFRKTESFDYKSEAKNPGYWQKALASMVAASANWHRETAPPSGIKLA